MPWQTSAPKTLAILALGLTTPAAAQRAAIDNFPLRIDRVEIVGRDAELGRLAGARVAPDGSVYAIDSDNTQIVAFSPEGRLLWRSGGKGRGPGEFQLPYRLAVDAAGTILVFDMFGGEVSFIDPNGRFRERVTLPFGFTQVDHFVAARNGELVFSGVTKNEPRADIHGIHRFSRSEGGLKWVASFGPLPPIQDRLVLEHWGAGVITPAANGDLLYSLKTPYAIHRFDSTGRLRSVVRPPVQLQGRPEDAVRVERIGKSRIFSSTDREVVRPGAAWELPGGWILSMRISERRRFWDLIDPAGRVRSRSLPEEWLGMAGYDAARRVIWLTGTADDEPVLLKLTVRLVA